ncbi:terminase [Vibrio phage CJY]|uniref:Terminase n=1 Tax=Vibrio phage J2 TaxID=1558467 RepID=A0A0A7HEG6_9CAUD|nr:terminase [Vibrio phage J2]AIZ01402.1 terminase [Vibrio phage CJY]AIZ01450.1 terminase [Vibrio phage H1]AIZ01498.1 terminase [Vibrio phage H2 SGB-2014]AIZ01546.1 terminase [Vibrio phage H3]AIZ01642.1 terminase [Vibrio phage J3]
MDDIRPWSGRNAYEDDLDVDVPVLGPKWDENTVHKKLPNNFIPRGYQEEAYDHILSEHLDFARRKNEALSRGEEFNEPEPSWRKKAIQVLHRRAGKDIGALHLIAIASQLRVGNYKHILPYKTQARDAIWDGIDALGNRFIRNAFPDEIVESINESRMLVRFTNGSTYQLQGGDSDKLVGAGPVGIVYSESALMSPNVRTFLRPMLDETGGWELHITTPRGKNWFYKLAMHAEKSEEWYYKYLTINDTWRWAYSSEALDTDTLQQAGTATLNDGHVIPVYESIPTELKYRNVADAEKAIERGVVKGMYAVRIMTERMVQSLIDEGQDPFIVRQEYYCDWDVALQGSYYGDLMITMYNTGRIGKFPHNPNRPVYVHMDIGFNDSTSITFTQEGPMGQGVIIDHLWGSNKSLLQWVYDIEEHANKRDYALGLIILPHDADNTEVSHGKTRKEWVLEEGRFEERGMQFDVLERADKQAGIDATRGFLATCCIDETNCEYLIEALKSFRREYDEKNQTYRNNAVHDWASHPADNVRYLASSWDSVLSYVHVAAKRSRGNKMKANIKVKRALH